MTDRYIQTCRGGTFNLENPNPEDIVLSDVAHALSHICRYTGHCSVFYSVAQHSVLCSRLAAERGHGEDIQREALLHDATEAYVGDVASPLKALLPDYVEVEARVRRALASRFSLCREVPKAVKELDQALLMWEAPRLLGPLVGDGWPFSVSRPWRNLPLTPWSPAMAMYEFMDQARRLGVY